MVVVGNLGVIGLIPREPLNENVYTLYGATKYAREEFSLGKL